MSLHRIRRGLDLPIAGEPEQRVDGAPSVTRVAVVCDDFHGLRPRLRVSEGQEVRRGEALVEDTRRPGVVHTSPGAGRVAAIHRGDKRVLQSVVVELSDGERAGEPAADELERFGDTAEPERVSRSALVERMVRSGLWTALRTRPFSQVPRVDEVPEALFVTAIDTSPLAPDPQVVVADAREDFQLGLRLCARLSGGETHLCVADGSGVVDGVDAPVSVRRFAGRHPAGLAGTHIHLLHPVGRGRTVWTFGYQDVIALGRLFARGHLDVARVVALGGPPVPRPRLFATRLGASLDELVAAEGLPDDCRLISGSVLSGKRVSAPPFAFLGRHDVQVSVLQEGRARELLGWLAPGRRKYSALPAFLSRLLPRQRFAMTTLLNGSRRAMLPVGVYERVMPLDILPTFLLRALLVDDLEQAEKLGCLELDEEDLALCTFVCPSKIDYGPHLRRNLELLQEGLST